MGASCVKSKTTNESGPFEQSTYFFRIDLSQFTQNSLGTFSKLEFTTEDLVIERKDPLELNYQLMDPPLGRGSVFMVSIIHKFPP